MSERDRLLTERTGLTVTGLAELIGRSRQTVAKGVGGKDDYFTPADFEKIARRSAELTPDKAQAVHDVVVDIFQTIADQVGRASGTDSDITTAIATCERLWLAFPDYLTSYRGEQIAAYREVYAAIDERRPGTNEDKPLEVIVWSSSGRSAIETQFDDTWHEEHMLAVVVCDVVDGLNVPMVIVDPHLETGRNCFALGQTRFAPMAPEFARSRVREFATSLARKSREGDTGLPKTCKSMLQVSPALINEVGVAQL